MVVIFRGGCKIEITPDIANADDVDDSAKGNDKVLVYKTATGKHEYEAPSGGGVTDHGALTGLADDDHPQYTRDAEVDAIVATHTAIAAAHHAKYTDAEVDAIVLTHKNITAAHHVKYTDAEVDAIVATHTAIAAAHHAKTVSGDIDIHLAKDVEDAAIGNDKVLVYKTATSKHEYEAQSGGGTSGRGFYAWRNTAQSIPSGTETVVIFQTEDFDTENEYNAATGIYTPQTAGYYIASTGMVVVNIGDGKKYIVRLEKNGNLVALDRGVSGGVGYCGGVATGIVQMNGSTDYLRAEFYHDHGSSRDLTGNARNNFFCAWRLPSP